MTKSILSILLIYVSISLSFAQADSDLQKKIKKFTKKYSSWTYIPETSFKTAESTMKVGNFMIFNQEVSNLDWKEFVAYKRQKGEKESADAFLPDTILWRNFKNYEAFESNYYISYVYNSYPVVNISYDQALAYCKWLEEFYNNAEDKIFKKVTVTLPTEEEWAFAAAGGLNNANFSWVENNLYDSNNRALGNFFEVNQADIYYDENPEQLTLSSKYHSIKRLNPNKNSLATTKSYNPNAYGLYCMSGNVSEFILGPNDSDYCVLKGGSWVDPGYYLLIRTKQFCLKGKSASPFRGFRPILKFEF